jgi:acetylornithine deacetylase/succinyl-diaminopimelate desuccinylase-like protein
MAMEIERVFQGIDREELVALAVEMGNIYSPSGEDEAIADFLFDWLDREGFQPRRVALLPSRPNIVATLKGSGGGTSLIFNSHIDTAIANDETAGYRMPMPEVIHKAWVEGELIRGHAIINDRGPLAASLIAAKAIKKSGLSLKGDLILAGVAGETTREPVDEFESPEYLGKEVGTRYTIVRGVLADFALVCEATAFTPVWVEAGEIYFKVRIHTPVEPLYTPYIPRFTSVTSHPNAIVRAAALIQALAEWANRYEDAYRYECPGGVVVPKVNIGAIRGGVPYRITRTLQFCDLHLDVRMPPKADPLAIRSEIEQVMKSAGIEGTVEATTFRPGYEGKGVEPLVEALTASHRRVLQADPKPVIPSFSSMWRDISLYNEVGIPAVTYGPALGAGGGNAAMRVDDLLSASRIYALTAMELCSRVKPPNLRAGPAAG